MSWFFIALISPALWAVSNHTDKYILTKFFKGIGAGAYIIFSAFIGFIILLIIPIFEHNLFSISLFDAVLIIFSGIIYISTYIPYSYALREAETSVVVPLFQIIPVFGYILGYVFLNERLSVVQMLAALLIIIGAIGISLEINSGKFKLKSKVLLLMIAASFLGALTSLIFKLVAIKESFWITSFWEYVGFTFATLTLLFIPTYRHQFFKVIRIYKCSVVGLDLINEIFNISARIIFSFASLLAPLALVWAVNGFQPFFVFIYGIILTLFLPKIATESLLKKHLAQKFISIIIMFIGVYFLNK